MEVKLRWALSDVDFASEAFLRGLRDRKCLYHNAQGLAAHEIASYLEAFCFAYTRRPEITPKVFNPALNY